MASKEVAPFSINLDSAIAVYVQIENQIQFAVAAGKLKPGDLLPSVREMSNMLDVNPNTITKAYRDLELLQVVYTRRGVGVTITEKAPKVCRERAVASVRDHLKEAVAECIACGLSAADIRKIVSQTIETAPQPYLAAE